MLGKERLPVVGTADETGDPVESQIREIVYEVEGGQMFPWVATDRLIALFRAHSQRLHEPPKVNETGASGSLSLSMSMLPPRNERKVYASTDGGVSWRIIKDGFKEPAELGITPAERLRPAR